MVLAAAFGDAAEVEAGVLPASELAALVRAGEVVRGRVDAFLAPVVAALAGQADGVLVQAGVHRREVRRRRRLAKGLVRRPEVNSALAAGAIGSGHAEVLVDHGGVLPGEVVATLLDEAPSMSVDAFEQTVLRAVQRATPDDGLSELERKRARRRCNSHQTPVGMGVLRIESDPVVHDELESILLDAVDVLWRQEHPDRAATAVDRLSFEKRRHDAVVAIFRRWRDGAGAGGGADSAGRSGGRGRRPRVVALLDAAALYEGLEQAGVATLLDGRPIPVGEARQLAAEHGVIPVVLGGRSEVLDVGRARRDANDAQRLALDVRQHGRCATDGCDRPIHHAHHAQHWEHGGRSDLDNLLGLCGTHHRELHDAERSDTSRTRAGRREHVSGRTRPPP